MQSNDPKTFPYLVDQAAFIDRVVLSLKGFPRKCPSSVHRLKNIPIGGKKRLYARCLLGEHASTGNPFQIRYAPLKRFGQLPPYSLVLRSVRVPLTGSQALEVIKGLMRGRPSVYVSLVELTFDLTDLPVQFFHTHLFTKARRFRHIEKTRGWGTLYVGSPQSSWQVRVYRNTDSVVRMEFILRLPFLRAHGIRSPLDLLSLRKLNLAELVWSREIRMDGLRPGLSAIPEGWRKRFTIILAKLMPVQEWVTMVAKNWRIDATPMLQASPVEALFRRMQGNLIW